jgi:hypothetical protein
MKKSIATISFLIASQSVAALAGVDVNINVGAPPPVTYQQPRVVVYESQPRFIFSPALGMYVSVGVPYDICYIGNSYYLYSDGFWYVGPTFSGPWVVAQRRVLPKVLKKYRYDQIRSFRDAEYNVYLRDPARYRGKVYEPAWKPREPRREELREPRREEPRREDMREPHREGDRKEERR